MVNLNQPFNLSSYSECINDIGVTTLSYEVTRRDVIGHVTIAYVVSYW